MTDHAPGLLTHDRDLTLLSQRGLHWGTGHHREEKEAVVVTVPWGQAHAPWPAGSGTPNWNLWYLAK